MKAVVIGREFVAELLGTMVLIMFGCGSVAQSVSLIITRKLACHLHG